MEQQVYKLKNVVVAFLGIIIGLALMFVAETIDQSLHKIWYGIASSLATTAIVGGVLGLSYEFYLRKEIIDLFTKSIGHVLSEVKAARSAMDARLSLSSALDVVGLSAVGPRESHYDYSGMITKSEKLFFVFNDGRTWFSSHHDDLSNRLNDCSLETHILLLHPESNFIESLSNKVDQTPDELRAKVNETVRLIEKIRAKDCRVTVHGHNMPSSYSLVMNDKIAIYTPYPIIRKADRIPCFIFRSDAPDGFYRVLRRDVEALIADSSTKIMLPRVLM
jgi:hypothetical protein